MKLKKIASLMLAGIMAVSMLAACGDANSNGGNGGEGEGEGTQTSGYSAVMAENVSKAVKDKEFVTFQDNAADQAALNKSVNFLSGKSVEEVAANQKIVTLVDVAATSADRWSEDWELMADSLQSELKMHNENMAFDDMDFSWFNSNKAMNEDRKCAVLYAVNGAVGTDEAVQTVAEKLSKLDSLVDEAKDTNSNTTWHYEYVVSVSVAEKSYNDSAAKFILVTVDRTVTNNK